MSSERPVARSARSTSTATGGEEAGGSATDASGCASPADPAPAVRVALFVVRGRNYLEDRIKIPAGRSLFSLVAVDMIEVERPTEFYSLRPRSAVHAITAALK